MISRLSDVGRRYVDVFSYYFSGILKIQAIFELLAKLLLKVGAARFAVNALVNRHLALVRVLSLLLALRCLWETGSQLHAFDSRPKGATFNLEFCGRKMLGTSSAAMIQ